MVIIPQFRSNHSRGRQPRVLQSCLLVATAALCCSLVFSSQCFNFVAGSRLQRSRASEAKVLAATAAGTGLPEKAVEEVKEAVEVAAETLEGKNPKIEAAKSDLMDLLRDSNLESEVLRPEGKPMRGRVDEAILRLERLNPTDEPVYSEELDGTWNVKYQAGYAPGLLSSPTRELALFLYGGGFSLGNALTSFAEGFWGQTVGLKINSKKVKITAGRDVDASAQVDFAGRQDSLSYKAEIMPLSASRMSEEVVSLKLPDPIGNQDLPLELRRSILITYLDEELMIVRDESGVSEVLVKELAPVTKASVKTEAKTTPETAGVVSSEEQDRVLYEAAESEAA